MVNRYRESDSLIVSEKPSNRIRDNKCMAEKVEKRRLAKGNRIGQNKGRTQSRVTLQSALDRIRQKAEMDRNEQFTAIWHHIYRIDRLRAAYLNLKRKGAPGIDGRTWE
jgi:RNA-directed DNA polymerase